MIDNSAWRFPKRANMVLRKLLTAGCCEGVNEIKTEKATSSVLQWIRASTTDKARFDDAISQTEPESEASSFVFGPTEVRESKEEKESSSSSPSRTQSPKHSFLPLVPFITLALGASQQKDRRKKSEDTEQRISAQIPSFVHIRCEPSLSNEEIFDPITPLLWGELDGKVSEDLAAAANEFHTIMGLHLANPADAVVAERLMIFMGSHPETCQIRYPTTNNTDDAATLYTHPLSQLSAKGCTQVVKAAYDAFPEAVGIQDSKSNQKTQTFLGLPLHYAAAAGHTETVEFLLSVFPEAVRQVNAATGATALHLACATGTQHACVELLASAYTSAHYMADHQGWTPQHYWVQNPAATVRTVRQIAPSLQLLTNKLENPLHLAVSTTAASIEILQVLHDLDATWVAQMDDSLQTCLHRAVATNQTAKVQWLLETYPIAAAKMDEQGRRPIELITATTDPAMKDLLLLQ